MTRALRWIITGVLITSTLWSTYFFVVQKNEELKRNLCILADNLSTQLSDQINLSYEKEIQIIEEKIQRVSLKIFAQRNVTIIEADKNSISYREMQTTYRLHAVVTENFWNNCLSIIPKENTMTIKYSSNDIQIIAELLNTQSTTSSLYHAKEYLNGIIEDSDRLLKMIISNEYIPPQNDNDNQMETLNLLKKYEWSVLAHQFEQAIKDELEGYTVNFIVENPPTISSEEQKIIENWSIHFS